LESRNSHTITGPNPYRALTLIDSLTLFDAIFAPPIDTLPDLPVDHMPLATAVLQHILTSPDCTNLQSLVVDKPDQYIAWLLASFSPWAGHLFPGVDTKKNIPAAATAAREGLKMMTKINNIIISSYRNYGLIQETVQNVGLSRSRVGMFVRELGAGWRYQYLCALLLEAIPHWKEGGAEGTQKVLAKYSTFLSQIKDMGLEEAHTFKTVLNGKKLMTALGQKKSGPWMMGVVNRVMEWQLENPEKDAESANEWVRKNRGELLRS